MSFIKVDENGVPIRYKNAVIDCQKAIEDGIDEIRTEQNHKGAVDINEIVAKTGVDRIAETMNIQALTFDENPYNNFQEMMEMVARGKNAFESLPAQVRDEFDNSPAKYMDYVQNPENKDSLIERGWLNPDPAPTQPVEVVMVAPATETTTETPPQEP